MAAHPHALVSILKEVGERIEHVFTVADQRLARGGLERAVAKARNEPRNEQPIDRHHGPRAAYGLPGDVDIAVAHQDHQERTEPGILDARERAGRFPAGRGGRAARIFDQPVQRGFCRVHVAFAAVVSEHDRRRHGHARRRVIEVGAHQGRQVLFPQRRQRMHGRRPHVGVFVAQ